MDTLIAQYTEPVHDDEIYDGEYAQLTRVFGPPTANLKFTLPPIAQVRIAPVTAQTTQHRIKSPA